MNISTILDKEQKIVLDSVTNLFLEKHGFEFREKEKEKIYDFLQKNKVSYHSESFHSLTIKYADFDLFFEKSFYQLSRYIQFSIIKVNEFSFHYSFDLDNNNFFIKYYHSSMNSDIYDVYINYISEDGTFHNSQLESSILKAFSFIYKNPTLEKQELIDILLLKFDIASNMLVSSFIESNKKIHYILENYQNLNLKKKLKIT